MKGIYTYYVTPGHGYLCVPQADLQEIGFVPTPYSLYKGNLAYLEEDCDMSAFMWAYELHEGVKPEVKTEYLDSDIPKASMVYYPDVGDRTTYETWRQALTL